MLATTGGLDGFVLAFLVKNGGLVLVGILFGVAVARLTAPSGDWVSAHELADLRHELEQSERDTVHSTISIVNAASTDAGASMQVHAELGPRPASEAQGPDRADLSPTPQELDQQVLEQATARIAWVQHQMASAPTDSANVARATRALRDYQVTHPNAPQIDSISCTSSWCEFRLEHAEADGAARMSSDMMAVPGFSGAGIFVRESTSTGYATTMVVAQDGSSLP